MRDGEDAAKRLCSACGTGEAVAPGEALWPVDHACPTCGFAPPLGDGVPLLAPRLADTISGFDPSHFAALAQIEDDHFWFVPRNRLLADLITRYFPGAGSVLELGCGGGVVLAEFARQGCADRLFGTELHPAGLVHARRRLGARAAFAQMDARHIMAENAFDVIGAFDVIEHIAEDEAVLASAHRALRPGGGVILAVPQHPWLWSAADEVAHHQRRYRRGELEGKLARNGFEVAFSGSYCATLLPLMMASRWISKLRQRSGDKPALSAIEAKPGDAVNAALKAVLQAEVTATLRGVRFPVGGSRVVVARCA